MNAFLNVLIITKNKFKCFNKTEKNNIVNSFVIVISTFTCLLKSE